VTGRQGQVARALLELGPRAGIEIRAVARPEFDLTCAKTVEAALRAAQPDAIVSATAYTAVDNAESESGLAFAINASGADAVARTAAALAVPSAHLSTDYVFAGDKPTPYIEDDPVGPLNVYGASKLAGERAVVAATTDYVILRTSWVYSPFGANFVKTMLRLGAEREVIRMVADQWGYPTSALDIRSAVADRNHKPSAGTHQPALRSIFHLTGSGLTSWSGFASAISASRRRGGPRLWSKKSPPPTIQPPRDGPPDCTSTVEGSKPLMVSSCRTGNRL
jgi:dTDP-4-dehydrorhamnose reductase